MTEMPAARPRAPFFSSGPCAKRPGWSLQNLKVESLGRSHRAKLGKARLKLAIDLTREVLEVPADYRIGIVPASDTGAVEPAGRAAARRWSRSIRSRPAASSRRAKRWARSEPSNPSR